MELTSNSINSYQMQSISIKRESVLAQYNISSSSNGTTQTMYGTKEAYSLDISYEGRMAQIETDIYDKISKRVNGSTDTETVDETKTSEMASYEEFYSPDKVAERITDFARSLFPMWLEQNRTEDQTDEEAIEVFMEQVNKGVEEGFAAAGDILKGAGILAEGEENDGESIFSQTYEATKERLNDLSSVLLDDAKYINSFLDEQEARRAEELEATTEDTASVEYNSAV